MKTSGPCPSSLTVDFFINAIAKRRGIVSPDFDELDDGRDAASRHFPPDYFGCLQKIV